MHIDACSSVDFLVHCEAAHVFLIISYRKLLKTCTFLRGEESFTSDLQADAAVYTPQDFMLLWWKYFRNGNDLNGPFNPQVMLDENTMRNDTFPTYVGFLSVFCIVPAHAGDKEFIFFWCCLTPGTATGERHILSCLVQLLVKCWRQSFYFWLIKRSSMKSLGFTWALWASKNLYEIITWCKQVANLSGARISFKHLLEVWAKFLRRNIPWSPPLGGWSFAVPFQNTRMCLSITIINLNSINNQVNKLSSVSLCFHLQWHPSPGDCVTLHCLLAKRSKLHGSLFLLCAFKLMRNQIIYDFLPMWCDCFITVWFQSSFLHTAWGETLPGFW